eukprot:COSAG06_NODE_4213_length_4471_cov_2.922919_6_plen_85_part_00
MAVPCSKRGLRLCDIAPQRIVVPGQLLELRRLAVARCVPLREANGRNVFECFSLCLSRACLGKLITFMHSYSYKKWTKSPFSLP